MLFMSRRRTWVTRTQQENVQYDGQEQATEYKLNMILFC